MDTTSDWPERASRCLEEHYEWRHLGGLISKQTFETTKRRLEIYVNPFLTSLGGTSPNDGQIGHFVDQLSKRGLSSPTCKQVLFLTRKVIEQAQAKGLLASMNPIRPHDFVRQKSIPRGGFRFLRAARALRGQRHPAPQKTLRKNFRLLHGDNCMPPDLAWAIGFMVNSFIRPSDLKFLKHRHVEVVRGKNTYLRLTLPETKKHDAPIVSLRPAVRIYQQIKQHYGKTNRTKPDDYLFLPELRDRNYALALLSTMFNWVLEETGLKVNAHGQPRAMYSLRHSAITFRLLYGSGIDLLTLARNARTSVEVINDHYASTVMGEQNIAMLQSRRGNSK